MYSVSRNAIEGNSKDLSIFVKVIYFYTSFFSFKTTFVPVLQPNLFIFCLSIMVTVDGYDSLLRLEKYFILSDKVNLL